MIRLVCAVLLLAVAITSAEERVVGGYPSSVERYPSVLQVQRSTIGLWRQFCAGIILTSRFSVSAAGCFVGPNFVARLRRVIAGSTVRNVGGQVSGVSRIIKHPYWNEGANRDGDIAIIELETPLQYTLVVQQATILGQGAYVPDNMAASTIGWGATLFESFPAIYSDELRELDVITINNLRCATNYYEYPPLPLTVTLDMICAAPIGFGGACLGDRGGPLYINDIVVGLTSWGWGCSNNTFPTVFTAIPSYTNWIVDNAF